MTVAQLDELAQVIAAALIGFELVKPDPVVPAGAFRKPDWLKIPGNAKGFTARVRESLRARFSGDGATFTAEDVAPTVGLRPGQVSPVLWQMHVAGETEPINNEHGKKRLYRVGVLRAERP